MISMLTRVVLKIALRLSLRRVRLHHALAFELLLREMVRVLSGRLRIMIGLVRKPLWLRFSISLLERVLIEWWLLLAISSLSRILAIEGEVAIRLGTHKII
jgi:hypothetical protein